MPVLAGAGDPSGARGGAAHPPSARGSERVASSSRTALLSPTRPTPPRPRGVCGPAGSGGGAHLSEDQALVAWGLRPRWGLGCGVLPSFHLSGGATPAGPPDWGDKVCLTRGPLPPGHASSASGAAPAWRPAWLWGRAWCGFCQIRAVVYPPGLHPAGPRHCPQVSVCSAPRPSALPRRPDLFAVSWGCLFQNVPGLGSPRSLLTLASAT